MKTKFTLNEKEILRAVKAHIQSMFTFSTPPEASLRVKCNADGSLAMIEVEVEGNWQ